MYKGTHEVEPTFDDAIISAKDAHDTADGVSKTTIHIPLWVRIAVARVHVEAHVSEGKIYTALIDIGAQIIKIRYGKQIKEMEGVRYKLMKSNNELIRSLIGDFHICVNGVQGGKDRRTVRIVTWNVEYLGAVGAALRMEFSSMVRLALYLVFQSCRSLIPEDVVAGDTAISTFEQKLGDYGFACKRLAYESSDDPSCISARIIDEQWEFYANALQASHGVDNVLTPMLVLSHQRIQEIVDANGYELKKKRQED